MRFVRSVFLLLKMLPLATVLVPSAHAEPGLAVDVNLEWDPSPDSRVVGYNVYRFSDFWENLNGATLVSGNSFTDSTAMLNQFYYYAVTAVDELGLESEATYTTHQTPGEAVGDDEFWDDTEDLVTGAVSFIEVAPEATRPSLGMALIDDSDTGSPISGAVFQSAVPVQYGRIHVRVQGPHHTGIAMSNPNAEAALINYSLVDEAGYTVQIGQFPLSPGDKISALLGAPPFDTPLPVDLTRVTSFSFWASAPIATAAVRTFTNELSDVLMTPLAISNLESPLKPSTTIPFYADGGGWQSEIHLVNPTGMTLSGTVQLVPTLDGGDPDLVYHIPPYSAIALHTAGLGSVARSGWVQITPATGTPSPGSSLLVFNNTSGVTTTLGTVYATNASSSHHVYVEELAPHQSISGPVQTVVTIANPASTAAFVTLDLLTMGWEPLGVRGTLTVGAYDKASFNVREIPGMESIDSAFTGILRIGGDAVIAASFLIRHEDPVVTVLPSISAVAESSAFQRRFLFRVEGGGYSTRLIDVHAVGASGGGVE
jgi:hypothetical protein